MADKSTIQQLEAMRLSLEIIDRALRGTEKDVGLVGKVENLTIEVHRIANNDLKHLKSDLMDELKKIEKELMNEMKDIREKAVTWPSIGKGFLGPILIAVITALLVTGLHRLFFP